MAVKDKSSRPPRVGKIVRWEMGRARQESDELAEEEPLEIRARGRSISVTMRTPGHDAELATGFLLTEGLIHSAADVLDIEPCDQNEEGNVVNVLLAPHVHVDFEKLTRHVFASSSCGLCGKASIEAIRGTFPPIAGENVFSISAELIAKFPEAMRPEQSVFDRTGGLHAAGIFDERGKLLILREDIGRHNAVDKVLGRALLDGMAPLNRHILLVSGRASFEIMQKALAASVPIVASVSAPSSLAVDFAVDAGQTLVGFVREGRLNVYAGFHRVLLA
jgi:FdhD protein